MRQRQGLYTSQRCCDMECSTMQPTVVCWPPPAPSRSFVGHLAGMLAGYAVALGAFSWLNPWWSLSLLAWAAMGLSYAAARSRQLVIPYIRLPGGAAFGLGGSPGGGGGGGDVESGGVGAKAGAKAGVTRIVGGEIVRT